MTIQIKNKYQQRPVRFLEVYQIGEWQVKIYTMSIKDTFVSTYTIQLAKKNLQEWLSAKNNYALETYNIATLILHQGKEGCFAVINWWIDENMLQQFVYLARNENPTEFSIYSDKGIITCVWEMAVLWFERNLWIKYILKNNKKPDFKSYLNKHLNADV